MILKTAGFLCFLYLVHHLIIPLFLCCSWSCGRCCSDVLVVAVVRWCFYCCWCCCYYRCCCASVGLAFVVVVVVDGGVPVIVVVPVVVVVVVVVVVGVCCESKEFIYVFLLVKLSNTFTPISSFVVNHLLTLSFSQKASHNSWKKWKSNL